VQAEVQAQVQAEVHGSSLRQAPVSQAQVKQAQGHGAQKRWQTASDQTPVDRQTQEPLVVEEGEAADAGGQEEGCETTVRARRAAETAEQVTADRQKAAVGLAKSSNAGGKAPKEDPHPAPDQAKRGKGAKEEMWRAEGAHVSRAHEHVSRAQDADSKLAGRVGVSSGQGAPEGHGRTKKKSADAAADADFEGVRRAAGGASLDCDRSQSTTSSALGASGRGAGGEGNGGGSGGGAAVRASSGGDAARRATGSRDRPLAGLAGCCLAVRVCLSDKNVS